MTRQEIASLLEILVNQYPYTKIDNAKAMTDAWEMCLGDYSAESVYKAARLHMETCKFFPTIADINEKIVRAELVYSDIKINKLEDGSKKESFTDEWYEESEEFCKWIGLGYPMDDEED